jgi:hypothetical protein
VHRHVDILAVNDVGRDDHVVSRIGRIQFDVDAFKQGVQSSASSRLASSTSSINCSIYAGFTGSERRTVVIKSSIRAQ